MDVRQEGTILYHISRMLGVKSNAGTNNRMGRVRVFHKLLQIDANIVTRASQDVPVGIW